MMFGIKTFEECVTDDELRALWIEIAQKANLTAALEYMENGPPDFDIVDETWGSPAFWKMANQIRAIAKHFDYSVEAGFLPPFKLFDFEIMSPEARKALDHEYEAAIASGKLILN